MKKKILITATELHLYQFWTQHIKMLIQNGYSVDLVCSHVGDKLDELKQVLLSCENPRLTVVDLKRSPLSPHNIRGYFQLKKYFSENKYDLIITNEPVMGVMTRLASRAIRKKHGTRLIYFAHGFHFWKGAPLLNWALFYPIEKLAARITDVIVTMNSEDYQFAKEHFNSAEIEYTNGIGADFNDKSFSLYDRNQKRRELNLSDSDFMVFSASELTDRKNLRFAFDVIEILVNKGYKNIKFFVRGKGPLENDYKEYIKKHNLGENIFLLGYGRDINQMCCAADAFLFTSKQEGLPVAVMEAMSCNLPCVCSNVRGASDLISNGNGGFVCSLSSPEEFASRLEYIMKNDVRRELTENNERILEPYSFESVHNYIESLISKNILT